MELAAAAELLRRHDRYCLITHRRPDGDTLGCAGALCHALRRLGKTAFVYPNADITDTYRPFLLPYFPEDGMPEDVFCVALDVADPGMVCSGFTGKIDLWLDHHPGRGVVREPGVIRPDLAACGELVLDLIVDLLGAPDREEADLLYMAVSTDTGCFCYANTTAATHRAAAAVMDAGADAQRLNKLLFRTKSRARFLLEGQICSSLRSFRSCEINAAVVTLEMLRSSGAVESDLEDLAGIVGQVAGNRVAITIRELSLSPARCKVSLRTDGGVDAARVCARFGGGGHRMASGCELPLGPEETLSAVLAAVEEEWA